MDDAKKKIVPASVLCLAPDAAATLARDLVAEARAAGTLFVEESV